MCCMPGKHDTSLHVLRRLPVYDIAVRGSWLPGGAVGLTIGPDNIEFRKAPTPRAPRDRGSFAGAAAGVLPGASCATMIPISQTSNPTQT